MSHSRDKDRAQPTTSKPVSFTSNNAEFEAVRSAIGGGFFKTFENLYLNSGNTKGVLSSIYEATTFAQIETSLQNEKKRIEGLLGTTTQQNKSLLNKYIAFLAQQLQRLSEFKEMIAGQTDRLSEGFRLEKITVINAIDTAILYKEFSDLRGGAVVIPNYEEKQLAPYRELREQVKAAADPKSLLDTIKGFPFYNELAMRNRSGITSSEQRLASLATTYAKSQQQKFASAVVPLSPAEEKQSFVKPGFDRVKKDIVDFLSKYTRDSRLNNIKEAIEKAKNPDSVIAILQLQRILCENPTEKAPDFSPLTDDLSDENKKQPLSESAYKKLEICNQRVEAWINNSPVPPMVAPASPRVGLFEKKPAAPKELSFDEIKQLILNELPKPKKGGPHKAVGELVEAIHRIRTFEELKNILELEQWLFENPGEQPDKKKFSSADYIQRDDDRQPLAQPSEDLYARLAVCLGKLEEYTPSPTNKGSFRPS